MDDTQTTRWGRNGHDAGRAVDAEIAIHRLAAERTLEQLERVVDYLRRIGKTGIAEAFDKNRRQIGREMSRNDD